MRLQRGTMVFCNSEKRSYWVIEWQAHNGIDGCYWIVDSDGNSATATDDELSALPPQ